MQITLHDKGTQTANIGDKVILERTEKHTDTLTEKRTNGQIDRQIHTWTEIRTDTSIEICTHRFGQTETQTDSKALRPTHPDINCKTKKCNFSREIISLIPIHFQTMIKNCTKFQSLNSPDDSASLDTNEPK